jgi:Glycosyltransferase 61
LPKNALRVYLSSAWKKIKRRLVSEAYNLKPIETLKNDPNISTRTLQESKTVRGVKPTFVGGRDFDDPLNYDGTQIAPEILLLKLTDVVVLGRTEFVLKNDVAYYPKVLDPKIYAFMLELEERGSVDPERAKLSISPRSRKQKVDGAISLLGQCNGNFAHWITEVLARLVLVDEIVELRGLPILVDYPVHGKLMRALALLNVSRREIISVRPYEKVYVKHLVYLTLPGVTPPETRHYFQTGKVDNPRPSQFQFSSEGLRKLRVAAMSSAQEYGALPSGEIAAKSRPTAYNENPGNPRPKLVYLPRIPGTTGNVRMVENAESVYNTLTTFGFSSLDTFNMPFELLLQSLQNAKIVVSPIGASLANLVFCPPGLKVIILTPYYSEASFYYFSNFLVALGHEATFVLGSQVRDRQSSVYNRNYLIRISELELALSSADIGRR